MGRSYKLIGESTMLVFSHFGTSTLLLTIAVVFISLWFAADPTNATYGPIYLTISSAVVMCGSLMAL